MESSSAMNAGFRPAEDIPPSAVAVVGIGCKFPGADSVEEFWDLLNSGKSMVTDPPVGRFPGRDHKRSTGKSVFFGNFLGDVTSFDNRFFKKSGREAASMDPQQRLLLEVAYQALESAGFFGPREQNLDVGCFVGACASDYNDNVASHPPNAFSTLGTLRAFLTGRISHFFGLSGPSVTFDTACSSSAVAIDAACKAILSGDCTSALAGGVSIFTSPHFYQNLAAASFLSPTGATKSFDAGADGYCRGEGIGLVVLKQLSQALADGDNILGTILATSVKQSSNKVPITVPHSPSHTALYRKVLTKAGVAPEDVTYLEAHGTGTPIGDLQEFEGIKETFGGTERQQPFYFASVKGNIGHTEGTSGVASLIKTLLMMQKRDIPRQANFRRLNPKINLPKQFFIPRETVPWTADTLIACVNNYGAAGSIAAMVVKEFPPALVRQTQSRPLVNFPIIITANSSKSLGENCQKLRQFISSSRLFSNTKTLADLAFNLSDKQNRALPNMLAFSVAGMSDLDEQLRIAASNHESPLSRPNPKPNPVILVFGGQTSRSIGLSESVYESSTLLRKYLGECDTVLKTFGYKGIFPHIFDTSPTDDVVALQTSQFALHYACAQAWIACGLKVDCILGHSFGQLVALTVSGVLSLADGLRLVYGRAVLMNDKWGPERGSMIALDADHMETMGLISSVRKMNPSSVLEVACFNGPRSHVLVGSAADIASVAALVKSTTGSKCKVLNVTHGFHSRFCDAVLPELESLASGLTYNPPKIPIETCSDRETWPAPTAKLIADHTRTPVYFGDAIKRINARYGSCTWLEAGSNSSVTSIARRALSDAERTGNLFYPINLSRDDAMSALAGTTVDLWRHGHHVQFWPFHRIQGQEYRPLNLPPYQFEKTRHWLEFDLGVEKVPSDNAPLKASEPVAEPEPVFITFSGFLDPAQKQAVWTIDPRSDEWKALLEGHCVLQQPLCPAPLYAELVLQAAKEVASIKNINCTPFARLDGLEITTALGTSQDKLIKLILTQFDQAGYRYDFAFQAEERHASGSTQASTHAVGKVEIISVDDKSVKSEFDRLGKLLRYQAIDEIAANPDREEVHGALVYRVFSRVVEYHDFYKGVRKIASNGGATVAQVSLPESRPSALKGLLSDPVAIDNFLQVPGLYVNCLAPCPSDEVFICTHVDRVQVSPEVNESQSKRWEVFAVSTATSDKEYSNDVFVKDQDTGKLVFVAFGASFSRVRITSLAKVIARANTPEAPHTVTTFNRVASVAATYNPPVVRLPEKAPAIGVNDYRRRAPAQPRPSPNHMQSTVAPIDTALPTKPAPPTNLGVAKPRDSRAEARLREVLSKMTDIPQDQFQGNVNLEDLGIDSLMATEIVSEIHDVFHVSIQQDCLQELLTFASLRDYLDARLGTQELPEENTPELPSVGPPTHMTTDSRLSGVDESLDADASSDYQNSDDSQDVVQRLASLLGSHLECPASEFQRSTNLADRGLDSLLCMELMSDIHEIFGVSVNLAQLTMESNFGELADILVNAFSLEMSASSITASTTLTESSSPITPPPGGNIFSDETTTKASSVLASAPREFEVAKGCFDRLADENGFAGFYGKVHAKQTRLVLAYTIEAFADLGIDLNRLGPGNKITELNVLQKHHHLRNALYEILRDGGIIDYDGRDYVRSDKAVGEVHSRFLLKDILEQFPRHANEHKLLNVCGADLARLMGGEKDPLMLLYGTKANRTILEDVYTTSPMYITMSRLLTTFLERALTTSSPGPDGKFHILEVGAGTGATTKWVVDRLTERGIPIEYTFTDISSSLVAAGKRKFSSFSCMKYTTLDIEKEPPFEYQGQFDIVLSTNCIHATSDLSNALGNISKLLRPHGFVSLVEFTTRFFWFDIVFGLLDGWWLFEDGRPYVLATPEFWEKSMRGSGFNHVSWTGGSTPESEAVRVITGFKAPVEDPSLYRSIPQERASGIETVVFKHTDKKLALRADVHYPSPSQSSAHKTWTVGTV